MVTHSTNKNDITMTDDDWTLFFEDAASKTVLFVEPVTGAVSSPSSVTFPPGIFFAVYKEERVNGQVFLFDCWWG